MVNFLNYFCFGLQVTPDQVGTFAEKQLRIQFLCFLRKILRHLGLWSVSSEVATVRKGPHRCVHQESVGSVHAVIYVNRLHLYPSHFHPVSSSESLELDPLKIVLETSWTSCRQGLQNHLSRLATVNWYLPVEKRDRH